MMLTAAMLIAAQAAATKAPATPTAPTKAAVQAQIKTAFEKMDSNKDGFIDKTETERAYDAAFVQAEARRKQIHIQTFTKLDADKNGSISRAEFDAAAAATPLQKASDKTVWLTTNDIDRNGRVALSEATAKALQNFDLIDKNRDGTLSGDEIRRVSRR
jgi:Ca2+-binding EF-hand superfamily protein